MIGAGNYASRFLIPSFAKAGARFHTLVASSGTGPVHVGRKFGFRQASTDVDAFFADPRCNTVVVATATTATRLSCCRPLRLASMSS